MKVKFEVNDQSEYVTVYENGRIEFAHFNGNEFDGSYCVRLNDGSAGDYPDGFDKVTFRDAFNLIGASIQLQNAASMLQTNGPGVREAMVVWDREIPLLKPIVKYLGE
jgi:hypothetical protein